MCGCDKFAADAQMQCPPFCCDYVCASTFLQVLILCPNMDDSDMLNGQMLEVEVGSLTDSIGELKSRLSDVIGIAANKQKLTRDPIGVLRDEQSLAFYNVSPDVQLQLGVRERGGKRR
jgi:splicing factor 3A subunit 1